MQLANNIDLAFRVLMDMFAGRLALSEHSRRRSRLPAQPKSSVLLGRAQSQAISLKSIPQSVPSLLGAWWPQLPSAHRALSAVAAQPRPAPQAGPGQQPPCVLQRSQAAVLPARSGGG